MRSRFQHGLDELKERLLEMGGMAEAAIELAADSYRKRDARLAQQVFEREKAINQSERIIDEMAVDLLAMQQPMATDLRFVLAVLKINSDLERVGDLAVNIAQRSLDLTQEPEIEVPVDIARMTTAVSTMVRRALESFLSGKAEVAQAVLEMDNIVDRMKDEAFVNLVGADERQSGSSARLSGRSADYPEPGTHRRSCHQHRRGCDLLGERRRRPAQRAL